MIFCIGDEIITRICDGNVNFSDVELSQQLQSIICSNCNILTFESNLIFDKYKQIINSHCINNQLKKIFLKCFREYSQIFNLTKKVVIKVVITISEDIFDSHTIRLSIDYLKRYDLSIGKAINILSEDDSDCEFYESLANLTNKEIDAGTNLRFRYTSGAGMVLSTNLKTAIIQNSDFVFAICDSDKNHPFAQFGVTASTMKDIQKELKESGILHFDTHVLEVHEKENLITPHEYQKFFNGKEIEQFIQIENSHEHYDYLIFYDLKKGITKQEFLQENWNGYFNILLNNFPNLKRDKNLEELGNKDNVSIFLGRKCLEGFDSKYLDRNRNGKIEKYREVLALIIWSWGISKGQELII